MTTKSPSTAASHAPPHAGGAEPAPHGRGRHWKIPLAVVLLIAAGASFVLFRSAGDRAAGPQTPDADLAWYSDDDGKTWFAQKKSRLNYVTRDGRVAYRCWVYTCDGGKTKFAAYLERYAPEAQKQLQAIIDGKRPADPAILEGISANGLEVKKPGAGNWISIADPRAADLKDPVCPGGGNDRPQLVPPGS
jgi:hypothetical protein